MEGESDEAQRLVKFKEESGNTFLREKMKRFFSKKIFWINLQQSLL